MAEETPPTDSQPEPPEDPGELSEDDLNKVAGGAQRVARGRIHRTLEGGPSPVTDVDVEVS